jgi:hypothetical protein
MSHLTVKSSGPFIEDSIVKNCLLVASQKLFGTNCTTYETVSLNQMAIERQVNDISKDGDTQLSGIFNKFKWISPQLHKCVYLHMV